jgi:transposase
VPVVNPFAKAIGRLTKTDKTDASVLVHFAEAIRPTPRPLPDEQSQALAALWRRRHQRVEMLTAEKDRLYQAPSAIHPNLQEPISWLQHQLAKLEDEMNPLLHSSPLGREKEDLL